MTDAELRTLLSAEMARLAGVVEAPRESLPGFSPQDAAVPFVQVTDGELHWVVFERE
jgi:hypothetical protein